MEPGSDEAYRDKLSELMVYSFNNPYHGSTAKRCVEGPQICTQAKQLEPQVIEGANFVAVTMNYQYTLAAPGKKTGSTWTQTIVFPAGERFFISSDRIDSVNASDAPFLRLDMPGHIKHNQGRHVQRGLSELPGRKTDSGQRVLRPTSPRTRNSTTRATKRTCPSASSGPITCAIPRPAKTGPWLAGMTLNADIVSEAWCHQRGYVCLIEEFGGRPIKAGGASAPRSSSAFSIRSTTCTTSTIAMPATRG